MRYSIFSNMINGGTSAKNRPSKGAGSSRASHAEATPSCRIVRIGGHKLREKKSLDRRLKDVKAGDWVVLEYGGNYCDYDWAAISAYPDGEHSPAFSFGQFREIYSYAITRIQALGAKAALLTLPALLPQRYFDHVSRNLDRKHILHWLRNDVCNLNRWHDEYNDEILSLAAQYHILVIDISKDLLLLSHAEDCYKDDGMHPNGRGQGVIAELVANWHNRQA